MMGHGFGMGWGWLFGLLLLVGLGLLIVVAVRALGGGISRDTPTRDAPPGVGGPRSPARSSAREILDERYARGELNTEEYHERLQTLGEDT
jgi:putative membrane protein